MLYWWLFVWIWHLLLLSYHTCYWPWLTYLLDFRGMCLLSRKVKKFALLVPRAATCNLTPPSQFRYWTWYLVYKSIMHYIRLKDIHPTVKQIRFTTTVIPTVSSFTKHHDRKKPNFQTTQYTIPYKHSFNSTWRDSRTRHPLACDVIQGSAESNSRY